MSAAAALLLLLAAAPCALGDARDEEAGFTVARIRYGGGGDWYSDPTSLPNLLSGLRERTGLIVQSREARVEIADEELFRHPFLYMTGHGQIRFSPFEAERLRYHLVHGGFLWADDNYGMDEHFRREIRAVFPEAEMVELPFDHPIYHCFYDFPEGLPKIHEHDGKFPRGYGIFHDGRLVVFYTYETDIGDGLEDEDVHKDPPEKREAALRMAINIVTYSVSH
ncbi:MAG: DUF4159 domain-containing protein [Candidatus Eisenbacteria bacterium]|nr:DUF4159 domain-containing protein [Candidatus Eisenbacteria bacterium]